MNTGNFFTGLSAALWGLTFGLIGFITLAATAGGHEIVRLVLVAAAVYSVIGVIYGGWAARVAVSRANRD